MPVTTTASHGFSSGAVSSLTISHTSDTNPLYVLLTWFVANGSVDSANAVTGITYNGVALTRGGHAAVAGNTMEWWRLDTPASGAHNLVISLSPTRRVAAGVFNLSGWPSVLSDHQFVANGKLGLPPPVVTVNSRVGADVVTWIGFNDPTQNVTQPSGATPLWNDELLGGGSGSGGDQVSAASSMAGAYPSVAVAWSGSLSNEYFGVAALSFTASVGGVSSRNLLTGDSHDVQGSDNLIAGATNAVTGDKSEAHGEDGTVNATRSVLYSLDGSPHTLSADGVFEIDANDFTVNGVSLKNAITALTGDVTATGPGSVAATIANDAVTNAKAANMAQSTIKGRAVAAGTGDPTDLTSDQVSTVLDGATDPLTRKSYVDAQVAAGSGTGASRAFAIAVS